MSRGQRAVQSSAWRRRAQGLACARQVQSKAGEGLAGLCWQFGCTQLHLLGSARATNSVVVVPTSTDPKGILKSTREFKAPGAGKEHTFEVRGGGRDPGVRRPGAGLGRPTAVDTNAPGGHLNHTPGEGACVSHVAFCAVLGSTLSKTLHNLGAPAKGRADQAAAWAHGAAGTRAPGSHLT